MRGLVTWLLPSAMVAAGCGGGAPPDPCPGGVCPRSDSGIDAAAFDAGVPDDMGMMMMGIDMGTPPIDTGVPSVDTGTPPDDTGTMPVDTGTPPADTGVDAFAPPVDAGCGTGCVERWECSAWDTGGTGSTATRTCTDLDACGTTCTRPALTTTLPALDLPCFQCNVFPIWARSCGFLGCHGTESTRALRIFARGRHRSTDETWAEPTACGGRAAGATHPSADCEGDLQCMCQSLPLSAREWQRNFDSARGFALDSAGVPLASVTSSELLTQPLVGGGFTHQGIHFWHAGDPEYTTIRNWLSGSTLPSCTSGE